MQRRKIAGDLLSRDILRGTEASALAYGSASFLAARQVARRAPQVAVLSKKLCDERWLVGSPGLVHDVLL
jgi:hypothetical protein